MGPHRGAIAAIVVAISALIIPAEAMAAKKKNVPKPDLKITLLKANLGNPPYTVLGTDGKPESFEIRVTTKNQGAGTAAPSVTDLFIRDSNGHDHEHLLSVPRLRPHTRSDVTVNVTNLTLPLGFARIGAEADHRHHVDESDENNNLTKGERFAVVAKQWDVKAFDTISKSFFFSETTYSRGGFRFVLSRFDHASEKWLYKPYGSVTNQATETGICSGSSNATRTHNPWADSYLEISADLGGYDAKVQPSATETYSITITCLGAGSHTEQHEFSPLETFVGQKMQPVMKPNQGQLSDSVTDPRLMTTWTWDFRAAIP